MVSAKRGSTEVNAARVAIPASHRVPKITILSGPSAGRAVAMTKVMATVGRHPTNDLVVNDPRVSGVHLELRPAGDRVLVRDAGSTNGTWLGAHRVTEIELGQGGELTVGDSTLRVDLEDAATSPATGVRESFGELVGQSPAMGELFATLARIAPKQLSVLLQGETGSGKEEVARAIHLHSPRKDGPFIVIDATSLPETLVESLLFGHERGAFTGAEARTTGLFEAANGGTVFLDEIGELPGPVQAKFLRVLERQEFTRVGGHATVKVDVRVIAATHRDLRHEIEAGKFREDLYYRIAQVRIVVPPLRDRLDDIPLLCRKLLGVLTREKGETILIANDALENLATRPWPGNIRELRNVLARAMALASGGVVKRADVAGEGFGFRGSKDERAALDLTGKFTESKDRAIERFESAYLGALMRRCQGNLSMASREADIARHHLRDLLKRRGLYGITWDETKEG